ncbi:provicilin-like [Lotus japonicus]|uniref:Convicilin storage protein 1 n=2 Tax=Lotus japonicus TaxID=34305 RepID=B5U8K3_LOTJA|nr:provicilin-like [Lotus japonicus]CAR78993.1 convicilin storage protein 1 [Lotus japonicus]
MASAKIKARLPLLLLLGILFLVSVSLATASRQREDPCREQGEDERQPWQPRREREEHGREREEEDEKESRRPSWERKERTREWRRESEERDTPRRPHRQSEEEESDRPRRPHRESKERPRRHQRESEEEEGSSSSSESSRRSQRRNPFHFRSSRFQTHFENEHGHVRVLQRFDERSKLFENLQNYRILEFKAKPQTLVLPHHNDADSIIVILSGRAILTIVNPNDRDSYNLESGDALVIPAGATAYLANRDNDENLRVVKLLIPINRPGQYQPFFPSSSETQESYLNGFSRNILEASFNAGYDEIERVLLQREEQRGEQSQEQGVIVKASQDQIQQLSRHAKSSSRKRSSSKSEPFNLRSSKPISSNKFGKLFEITPEKNQQLRDLDILLSEAQIKEGSIFLPHYHSTSTLILVVNEGRGELELVAQRRQQQRGQEEEQEEEQPRIEAQRFRARLSPGDVIVIPASHPFAVTASSDLNLLAFGINAENNQRNFLAGRDDNVISQIERPVKELAFPGSAEEIESLIKNQRNSCFASAQPQQGEEEGRSGKKDQLSSILGAFF